MHNSPNFSSGQSTNTSIFLINEIVLNKSMKSVKIGNKMVGPGNPCFISFEPSATYSDLDSAKKMVEAAAMAGADAVKFQTFIPGDADRMMGKKDITIEFTTATGKKQELVYDALKRRELTKDEWKELVSFSNSLNVKFISSAYFPETIQFLADLKVDAIKVSKGDINNVLLIDYMAKTQLPIILDAREKLDDVDRAVHVCENNNNRDIVIMHCPSGYPAKNSEINLNAIKFLQQKYDYPIAFADHSPGGIMNYVAIGLGAVMLEKTITVDTKIEHVEHFMSLELSELKSFVNNIRAIAESMGDGNVLIKSRVEESARRSLVAKVDIKTGQTITKEMIDFWRPGDAGISCSESFEILNKKAKIDVSKGTFLKWDMLST
ncbi:MAG: hypothetical protein EB149_05175 [Thaumarchaeota archaeon]|nr:hypothetical protein [Nitrososphaerota archaeon]NDF25358.1 hypothetical protein [Nitrososphaerota archaeon]